MVAGPPPVRLSAGDRRPCHRAATHRWSSPSGWRRWRRRRSRPWSRPASCWRSRSPTRCRKSLTSRPYRPGPTGVIQVEPAEGGRKRRGAGPGPRGRTPPARARDPQGAPRPGRGGGRVVAAVQLAPGARPAWSQASRAPSSRKPAKPGGQAVPRPVGLAPTAGQARAGGRRGPGADERPQAPPGKGPGAVGPRPGKKPGTADPDDRRRPAGTRGESTRPPRPAHRPDADSGRWVEPRRDNHYRDGPGRDENRRGRAEDRRGRDLEAGGPGEEGRGHDEQERRADPDDRAGRDPRHAG